MKTGGLLVLVALLAVSTGFGLYRRQTDGKLGRWRATSPAPRLSAEDLGSALGARATLVQFSSAFCQPCRAARQILSSVAGMVEGVVHVELDAESHLDLVRRLGVVRTPTVLVLDGDGRIVKRATGLPRKADVIAVLGRLS